MAAQGKGFSASPLTSPASVDYMPGSGTPPPSPPNSNKIGMHQIKSNLSL